MAVRALKHHHSTSFEAVVPHMEFEPWSLLWISRNFHLNFAEQSYVRLYPLWYLCFPNLDSSISTITFSPPIWPSSSSTSLATSCRNSPAKWVMVADDQLHRGVRALGQPQVAYEQDRLRW